MDTTDKARRAAIFFDSYKLDKDHVLDSSSSKCIQDDLKVTDAADYKEY